MIRRDRRSSGEEDEGVRVTDRRRIYLDPEGAEQVNKEAEQPNLKPSYVEELELRTKAAEQQVLEVQARFDQLRQQLQRETDETRQRLARSANERAATDKANFIASLLPMMDDLERAIQATTNNASREAILEGIRGIATSFQSALSNAGVESIAAIGENFDPELHEAVDTVDAPAEMDGRVTNEYGRGFRIGDRLLRPARVQVGRGTQIQNATE
ncbi:MAG TPA: nucleotide exchange factor GrpE [Pyrinomonadaceae bacterium]